jgi:2-dehydro-3-deoxyphosphooctonate aldolase (KDO 8-P synthase)
MEVHDNPPEGLSDSTNMLYLSSLEGLLKDLIAINDVVKKDKEMGLVTGK